jgi:hypothetical protein
MADDYIYIKTNTDGSKQIISSKNVASELGHFTGTNQTHIYSHNLEKVICGSKSFHGCGLNHDLNIELLKEIGYAQGISCKRCQTWFKKHYIK